MRFEVDRLAFAYPGGGRSLADISFTLTGGEVACILGPNGAGKTTLIRCLLGGLSPSAGSVRLDGASVLGLVPSRLAQLIAHVPQTATSVFGHLVLDIVLMGRSAHLSMWQTPSTTDRKIARDALDRVGIGHLAGRDYATISGGERQLCLLARALAQGAPMLIMDEPAASLDYGNQIRILEIIAGLASAGFAILMTTHHPDHALQVGSQVLCLREGRLVGRGTPGDVLTSEFMTHLYDAPVRLIREGEVRACTPILRIMPAPAAQ